MTRRWRHLFHQEGVAFLNGLRFFTRIRIPDQVPHSAALLQRSTPYLPAIGLLVGSLSALTFCIAQFVLPQSVSVLLAMTTALYVTGGFHEDGLSDTADGLGGGWDKDQILTIMKDSRVGSYGVIAVVMVLLIKFASLDEIPTTWVPALLIAGHAFSRYCAILIMGSLDYVRDDASSKSRQLTTKLSGKAMIVASVFGLLPLLWLPFSAMVLGIVTGLLVTAWLGHQFRKWLGGYTGDCLGAVQQLSETVFYLAALTILG